MNSKVSPLIPLSALPIKFRKGRVLVRFMYPRDRAKIERAIGLFESLVGQKASEELVRLALEEYFGNFKIAKAVFYALRYFYEFSKPVSPPAGFSEWDFKRKFYEWVASRGSFIDPERWDEEVKEFAKSLGLNPKEVKEFLEADLAENQVLRRKRERPSAKLVMGIYNFLILEKLLSISEVVELTYYGEHKGELVKKLILLAKRHEVIADFLSSEKKLVIRVTGPHQIFKLPAVSEYGRHIAATIAPIIVNYERWRLYAKIVYRKKKGYFVLTGYEEDSPDLVPYWRIEKSEKPQETYDSSVEERIARLLKTSLEDKGIKVLREADAIVLKSGKVFIPDFTLSWNGVKVFLEVVGYWRDKYIEAKKAKLSEMATEGYRVIAVADGRLKAKLFGLSVPVFFYEGNHIPFGRIYREILKLLGLKK